MGGARGKGWRLNPLPLAQLFRNSRLALVKKIVTR